MAIRLAKRLWSGRPWEAWIPMPEGKIRVLPEGGVAVVLIDHPPQNLLTRSMVASLAETVSLLEESAEVRAVVAAGAGDRAFCGGLDGAEWARLTPKESQDALQEGFVAFWKLEHLTKPTVAAIEGDCRGAGAELAMACDFRVATEGASFALPEVNSAWMPSHGGTARLPRIVGRGRALEILLSGRTVPADEAREIGLIDVLSPVGEAVSRARGLARSFAEKPRAAVRAIKRTLTEGEEKPYRNRFLLETQHSVQLFSTDEYRNGLSKRPPGQRSDAEGQA